jgi:dynein heavy chain 1
VKRLNLLKMQGQFQQRLRHLEKDLLKALNESKGNILNDDKIITHLENLKRETAEISSKVAKTDQIMNEVETVINQYQELSKACSSIYITMDTLNQIHSLYQYSLQYFLEIFNNVLTSNANLKDVKDPQQRLKIIAKDLFYLAYYRLARGMLNDDRLVLALLLSKIYLKGFMTSSDSQTLIDSFYHSLMTSSFNLIHKGNESTTRQSAALTTQENEALGHLSKLKFFSNLKSEIFSQNMQFRQWLDSSNPELNVPQSYLDNEESSQPDEIMQNMKKILLIKAFRPDRFISIAESFINSIFGEAFLKQTEKMLNLADIIENEIKSSTPVLMCSVTGFDASGYVEDLASETNKQLASIAIGSSEGFTQAEKAINSSAKSGRWVLLKNVHLAPQWLVQLEKKIHSLQAHPQFRLFLSMEINSKIPSNLLRLGRTFVFEPAPDIKANIMRTLNGIPAERMNRAPAERSRLYFLLCWFHATIQERLRYVPLGLSKTYEFNESDLKCGLDTIDVWIDSVTMGRTNLPLNKLPFNAIYTLLSECVYGGKIDNYYDHRLLDTSSIRQTGKTQLFCQFI